MALTFGGEPHSAFHYRGLVMHASRFSFEPRVGRGSLESAAGHENVQPQFDVARFRLRRLRCDRFSGRRRCGMPKPLRPILGQANAHRRHAECNAPPTGFPTTRRCGIAKVCSVLRAWKGYRQQLQRDREIRVLKRGQIQRYVQKFLQNAWVGLAGQSWFGIELVQDH